MVFRVNSGVKCCEVADTCLKHWREEEKMGAGGGGGGGGGRGGGGSQWA